MPRFRQRRVSRREYTLDQRDHLESGHDYFGSGWGRVTRMPQEERDAWPSPGVEADMRLAWEHFRDELMEKYQDEPRRPWAWYAFDQGLGFDFFTSREWEVEALDRRGLLSKVCLEKLRADATYTRGRLNDCHEPPFTRLWGWWRFLSPERRDYDEHEAAQLLRLDNRYGDILSERERHVVDNHADIPVYARNSYGRGLRFDRETCAALGLPDSMRDDDDDDDD